jgi:hypothetical protein
MNKGRVSRRDIDGVKGAGVDSGFSTGRSCLFRACVGDARYSVRSGRFKLDRD